LGLAALNEHGITYPDTNETCIAQALEDIQWLDTWLDQHPQNISLMPLDPSIEHALCDALCARLGLCLASGNRPALAAAIGTHLVRRTIERRTLTIIAPFMISCIAQARSALLGEYRGGVRWTLEGQRAAQRLASLFLPECRGLVGVFASHAAPAEYA